MKNSIIKNILFTVCMLSSNLIFGIEHMQFLHFTKSNDFPFSSVDVIMQDSHGYLWIGSSNGLARYDGYTFEVYNTTDKTNGLPSNRIFDITETSKGDILISTNLGFVVYNRTLNNFKLLSYSCTMKAVEDENGQIWVATFDGIDIRNPNDLAITKSIFCETDNNIKVFHAIAADSQGNIWAATDESIIYTFNTQTNSFSRKIDSTLMPGIEQFQINNIQFDHEGNMWLGTVANGLFKVDTVNFNYQNYTYSATNKSTISHDNISTIFIDVNGTVWVCCESGELTRYNASEDVFERFETQVYNSRFLNTSSVRTIYQDNQQNYWIGTSGDGLYCYNAIFNNFQTFSSIPDYSKKYLIGSIESFVELDGGEIMLGSSDDGLKIFNPKTNEISRFKYNSQLAAKNIRKLLRHKNIIWGATWGGGIFQLDLNTNEIKNFTNNPQNPYSIPTNNVNNLFYTDTALIIGTHGAGVAYYNFDSKKFYHQHNSQSIFNDSVVNNWVNHLLKDKKNNLWISTFYGLVKINGNTIEHYGNDSTTSSLNSFEVLSTYLDSENLLWVITTQNVDLFDPTNNNFIRIGSEMDLPLGSRSLMEDNEGNIWISTIDKLVMLNTKTKKNYTYDKFDGILTGEMNSNATFKASDGTLYIGSSTGFMKFNPANIKQDTIIPNLCFRNLYVNYLKQTPDSAYLNQSIETLSSLEYEFTEDVISIEIAALLPSRSSKINYAYTFNDDKSNWLDLGKERTISFTGLRPGTYALTIKAYFENGPSAQKTITIVVKPKWWMTLWFYGLLSLIGLSLILLYVYWRIHNVRRKNILLEKIVKERTKNLELANSKLKDQSEILEKQYENLNESTMVIEMKNEELTETLSMKDKLIGIISHDFKNSLNSIIGTVSVLKMRKEEQKYETFDELINLLESSSLKLSNQMSHILDWAQSSINKIVERPVEVNLESLILDTIQLSQIAAQQKNIKISTQMDYTYCAFADPRMISTVIRNLLNNAIKFTEKGGNIMITVNEDDTMHEINVVDTGIGMPQHKVDSLFSSYDPANISYGTNNEKGTGLGLQICKTFIEKNNGSISIRSEEGKGSAFTVLLPKGKTKVSKTQFVQKTQTKQEEIFFKKQAQHSKQSTILIVDDNEALVSVLHNLYSEDFNVINAFDGRGGLYLAQNTIPNLIISDINMPNMSGLELCMKIKQNELTCHIPVILISSENTEDIEHQCYDAGANDFISKPFDPKILKQKINALLYVLESKNSEAKKNESEGLFDLPESNDDLILKKIFELINENYQDSEYSVEHISAKLGLSRSQLWRKIKSSINKTPYEVIRDFRLKKAAEMLKTQKYRVSDVAYHVGYNDPKVFQRNFSKLYGMSPSEYAKGKE